MKLSKKCLVCKRIFYKNPRLSRTQWYKTKSCSRHCNAIRNASIRIKNPAYREFLRKIATGRKQTLKTKIKRKIFRHGPDHPLWKGGISFDGKYLRETRTKRRLHRKTVEDFLGRRLSSDECVHHVDGNKFNNLISNLAIVSRAEHVRIHRPRLGKKIYAKKT